MRIVPGAIGLAAAAAALLHTGSVPAEGAAVKVGTFVYVHNRTTDSSIFGFSLATDGTLAALPGSPFATAADGGGCGGFCETMAYSKKRHLLFTGAEGGGIGVHRVLPGGGLTEVAGSPFDAGDGGVWGVAVVEKGRRTFVYGNHFQTDNLRGYEVQSDDTLVEIPGGPWATGDGPDGMASVKSLLFIANENDGTVSTFAVGSDGIPVSPGDPVPVTGTDFIYNVNPDPAGKFLYVGGSDDTVAAFKVDRRTGALTPLDDSPFNSLVTDVGVGVGVTKKVVVVPSNSDGPLANVQVLKRERDGSLGDLGGLQSTTIDGAECCDIDAKGKIFVSTNKANIQALTVNPKTGVVTPGSTIPAAIPSPTCLRIVRR